jgi:hypothetical protein
MKILGPDDLDRIFAKNPPSAILTGEEPDLEKLFLAYAEENGYTQVKVPEYGTVKLQLWVR